MVLFREETVIIRRGEIEVREVSDRSFTSWLWKPRWLALTEQTLTIHEEEGLQPFITIDLREISNIERTNIRTHCLLLETRDNGYYLSLKSDKDLAEWQDDIYLRSPLNSVGQPMNFSHKAHVGVDSKSGAFTFMPEPRGKLLTNPANTRNIFESQTGRDVPQLEDIISMDRSMTGRFEGLSGRSKDFPNVPENPIPPMASSAKINLSLGFNPEGLTRKNAPQFTDGSYANTSSNSLVSTPQPSRPAPHPPLSIQSRSGHPVLSHYSSGTTRGHSKRKAIAPWIIGEEESEIWQQEWTDEREQKGRGWIETDWSAEEGKQEEKPRRPMNSPNNASVPAPRHTHVTVKPLLRRAQCHEELRDLFQAFPINDSCPASFPIDDSYPASLANESLTIGITSTMARLGYYLLVTSKTGPSQPQDAATWLNANVDDIILNLPEFTNNKKHFDCENLARTLPIFQRFVIFVVTYFKRSGEDVRIIQDFRKMVSSWGVWDGITSLINSRSMNEAIWRVLRNCEVVNVSSDIRLALVDELQRSIQMDIGCICAQLAVIFNDPNRYRDFLSRRSKEARSLLDLLQTLLDWPDLDPNLKRQFVGALVRLSRKSGEYPECLVLREENVRKLGTEAVTAGQFGDVWKGQSQSETVSIKVLKVFQSSNVEQLLKGFSHEIAVWRQLSHANILPLYGVYRLKDEYSRVCLVSPWMENGNIVEFLKQSPDTDRYPLILDISQGLEYLHALKPTIIHGDLKGVNVLVTQTGRACIADFGLAAPRDSQILSWTSLTTAPTGGTLRWQAPELLDTGENDSQCRSTKASDIYSFACLCYEIFSGRVPFYEKSTDYSIIIPVTKGQRPTQPSGDLCKSRGLDQGMWDLIVSCWKHNPAERLAASSIVKILQSRLNKTPDIRPHHNWDTGFRSQLHYSLEKNLFPSRDYVKEALGVKVSTPDLKLSKASMISNAHATNFEHKKPNVNAIANTRYPNDTPGRHDRPPKTTGKWSN